LTHLGWLDFSRIAVPVASGPWYPAVMATEKYPGLYPATVVDDQDPLGLYRVKVRLPFLEADNEFWADCCIPIDQRYTKAVAVPYVTQTIWVMFAFGDIDRPVWIGSAVTQIDSRIVVRP
jgi:hypothetical protein